MFEVNASSPHLEWSPVWGPTWAEVTDRDKNSRLISNSRKSFLVKTPKAWTLWIRNLQIM
jgi:hypothetical protein